MPRQSAEFTMWFDVPDDPDHGRVQVRHLLGGEIQEIVFQAADVREVWDDVKGAARRDTRHDISKSNQLFGNAAVVGWENFLDATGKPIPCNAANKAAYAKEGWYVPFIGECREKVAKAFAEAEEKRLGNSKALPSGSPGSAGKAAKSAS